jgi:preprotein translocase subunit SecG
MMLLAAFSFWGFVKGLLMLVCILSALLLMLVVLLQEPKGGGLSSAFGGAGAETFGVQTGSVNKFTAWVAGIFMMSALCYATIDDKGEGPSVMDQGESAAPVEPGDGDDTPLERDGQAPGGN